MSTIIHHSFGGQTALVLVGERAAAKPARYAGVRRAPGIAERIECLKAGALAARQMAANARSTEGHQRMIDRAEKWERRAERLAEQARGRQQPGELFRGQ